MSVLVEADTPLAQALHEAIQPKLVQVGWSSGGTDESALSEYIILMLINGKTQDQIAAELSGDLLNLGPDDPGARDFASWLFEQVHVLNAQLNGTGPDTTINDNGDDAAQEGAINDADMGDAPEGGESVVPTGPKSMRNGGGPNRVRGGRMLGHMNKAMDRTSDGVLHRVRPQAGHERINTHSRGPPTGPRSGSTNGRQGPRMQNGTHLGRGLAMAGMPGPTGQAPMAMSPQQQMELYALLEQQARMMSQFLPGGMPMPTQPFPQPPQDNRSMFDRVQPNPHRNGFQKRPSFQQNRKDHGGNAEQTDPNTSMDIDSSLKSPQDKLDSLSPDTTCKFNLSCTNKDCKFAHQSPAAPPGTAIDVTDVCSFGAACKNRKCVGRHPSPAQRTAHQTTQDCKYFPNCTNPRCPFRHPSMPLCRNGADCSAPGCKFTHVKTACKHNPCLNPNCVYQHVDGQQRGKFDDKVWIADGLKNEGAHVSERKFVDEEDGQEELILVGGESTNGDAAANGHAEGKAEEAMVV